MDSLVHRTLNACQETARHIERAADTLGRDWPGWAPLLALCAEFRRQCDDLVAGRGLDMETIAFIGPKKAGKSTLLQLLLRDEAVRSQIKAGSALRTSTEKLVWVGPKQPIGMDLAVEEYVPCSEGAMPRLGIACTLADVPGENENNAGRARAAERALDLAIVKVVVLRFTDRRNEALAALARRAGRSVLLPVITQVKPSDDRTSLTGFSSDLASVAPDATVLEPLISDEFDHPDTAKDYPDRLAAELCARLGSALAGRPIAPLISDLLEGDRRRFIARARELAVQHLRASANAATDLHKAVASALDKSAIELLGSDRELLAGIRWSLRMTLLERTPGWCFPWRPLLAVASLASGALDRLPIALLGSLPSLGTVIFQSVKNVQAGIAFQQAARDGMRNRLSQHLREVLEQEFAMLDDALGHDFGNSATAAASGENARLEPVGLGELQQRSTGLIRESVELYSPSHLAAFTVALLGFLIFWGIFGWPLSSLYDELARGARAVWKGNADATALFPQGAGSMIITSIFLAVVPVFLLLLAVLNWFTRQRRVSECLQELRIRHGKLCAEMIGNRAVFVRVSEPKLDACFTLLSSSVELAHLVQVDSGATNGSQTAS